MKRINLKKIFNELNSKIGNKIICDKIYFVPAMRYWIDDIEKNHPQVITSVFSLSSEPYRIKYIKINPDLSDDEIKETIAHYLSQTMTIGDCWKKYKRYQKLLEKDE